MPEPLTLVPLAPTPAPEFTPASAGASVLAVRPTIPFEFAPVPALATSSIALVAVPFRLLVLSTVFTWPRLKTPPTPLPARAVVVKSASPASVRPSRRPLKNPLRISCSPLRVDAWHTTAGEHAQWAEQTRGLP